MVYLFHELGKIYLYINTILIRKLNILLIVFDFMQVILDSSFIISCVRARIDFLAQLNEQGFTPVVPREVLQEMKDLRNRSGVSRVDRIAIDVALEMLNDKKIRKISFGSGKVDDYLIDRGNEGAYIATLDRAIKKLVPHRVVIFSAQGRVGVEEGS